ncbi:hypothetical protein ASPCAL01985 [Aspergillus calidoustus]|uniref:Uncharacterized protein n=1 Tax=Aspergillus calidoustus TaxID=454130 RepID=A0A0U5GNJ6_ASPCI|nr:hypothetical protein ASPCAL01985 [Aspergillus calidoustus]
MSWDDLPIEIHRLIFEHLAPNFAVATSNKQNLQKIFLVSKSWNELLREAFMQNNTVETLITEAHASPGLILESLRRTAQKEHLHPGQTQSERARHRLNTLLITCTTPTPYPAAMSYLLSLGADPSTTDKGVPLLSLTLVTSDLDAVKALLEYKPQLEDMSDSDSYESELRSNTPLGYAILVWKVEIAEALLKAGASLDIILNWYHGYDDPWEYISYMKGTEMMAMMRVLLDNGGVDLWREKRREETESGEHPLGFAVDCDNVQIAQLFLEKGFRPHDEGDTKRVVGLAQSEEMRALLKGYFPEI